MKKTIKEFWFGVKNPNRNIEPKRRIAIFASGAGTTAERVMEEFIRDPENNIQVIISDNPHAGILKKTNYYGVEKEIICCDLYKNGEYLLEILGSHKIDIVFLLGYLKLLPSEVVDKFKNSSVNLHPALLPKFGGKGMWGHHVHEAVAKAKESESGFSLHRVTAKFDDGDILVHEKVQLPKNPTAHQVENLVRRLEQQKVASNLHKLVTSGILDSTK